jgi:uncharacterized OsmC-like protein
VPGCIASFVNCLTDSLSHLVFVRFVPLCASVCASVCVCVCARVCACVCVCVWIPLPLTVTMRLLAERKSIPVRKITVELSHDRIYAKDCESCHTESGKIDRIVRNIKLEGDGLTDDHIKQLHRAADACPVHKSMETETTFVTHMQQE